MSDNLDEPTREICELCGVMEPDHAPGCYYEERVPSEPIIEEVKPIRLVATMLIPPDLGPDEPVILGVIVRQTDPWYRLGLWIETMDQGIVAIGRNGPDSTRPGEWSIRMEFGREAEDSPMAGGAAYGMGETLGEALNEALKDMRL